MEDDSERPLIGRRIKAIRDYFGETQEEFAERIGLAGSSQSEVGKWEKGKEDPPRKRVRMIADLVNAEPGALDEDDHQFCHGVRFGANAVLKLLTEGPVSAFWDGPDNVDSAPESPTGPPTRDEGPDSEDRAG